MSQYIAASSEYSKYRKTANVTSVTFFIIKGMGIPPEIRFFNWQYLKHRTEIEYWYK
jgi:hypothetical protein